MFAAVSVAGEIGREETLRAVFSEYEELGQPISLTLCPSSSSSVTYIHFSTRTLTQAFVQVYMKKNPIMTSHLLHK